MGELLEVLDGRASSSLTVRQPDAGQVTELPQASVSPPVK